MSKEAKTQKKGTAFFDVLTCTQVQVYPFKESTSGKTKAMARVTINDQLQLTGLRVVDGVNGFFVSYPLDPNHKGEEYFSIYYPLHKELREHIEQCILEKFQEMVNK
ncbi:MAG: SpoVG family protein [Fibromonadales bacterium]|nr:SpoVG family protein [Fibromonadales bacterium]